jgi:CheY-like chemotaxis protein
MTASRQITLLLVDDDESVRRYLRSFLEQDDFFVIEAVDGLNALELAADHLGRIDVVLTDYLMPRLNGLELRERLEKTNPGLPVILLSSYADEIQNLHSELIVFSKPFNPKLVILKIRELVEVGS